MTWEPPKLEPLDVHGIDDDGVYHPPSRARYDEIMKRLDTLEARETELLRLCTATENERRMWKARATAAKDILTALLVEIPTLCRIADEHDAHLVERNVRGAIDMHAKIDGLLRDAWCGAAVIAKEFVAAAAKAGVEPNDDSPTRSFVAFWRERFEAVLDPRDEKPGDFQKRVEAALERGARERNAASDASAKQSLGMRMRR